MSSIPPKPMMPSPEIPDRELIVTPGETITPRHVLSLKTLISRPSAQIRQVTLDMRRCRSAPSESIQRLLELQTICKAQNISLTMNHCSGNLLKTLIQESLEFLDIVQQN